MTALTITPLGTGVEPRHGGLTCTITTLADAPAGSTIVVFSAEAANGNPNTITDSAGNTYTTIHTTTDGANIALRAWTCEPSGADLPAGSTITSTWGSALPAKLLAAYAIGGVVAFDQEVTATPVVSTGISVTSAPLAQAGNEIAVFACVEANGQADGTYLEADGFTTLDTVYQSAGLNTAVLATNNASPIVYDPGVGVSNSLIALGLIFRGAPQPPPIRRMVARLRGTPIARPPRLVINGQTLSLPSGQPFVFRGINWDGADVIPALDAPIAADLGANVVRITIAFWFDKSNGTEPIPNAPFEAFNPTAPGYCDPTQLAALDAAVNAAVAAGLWPIITVHGGDGNFGTYIEPNTGLPVIQLFGAFWAFLAARYSTTPNVAAYEILSEPHPTNNPQDNSNNPASGNGPTDTGPGVGWLYNYVIPLIRAVDPITPIVVGAAAGYNFRTFDQIMATIAPQNQGNLIGTADWFELGGTNYRGPRRNGGYVRQTTLYPDFVNGYNYTGYPGYYFDNRGNSPNDAVYPGKGQQVYMNKDWLAAASAQFAAWSKQFNLPCFYNQFGGATGLPDMYQYTSDMADVFTEQGLGFVYWAQRLPGTVPNGAGEGIIWQAPDNSWHLKNGQDPLTLVMDQFGQFSGEVSTLDWFALLKAKFTA